MSNKECMWTLPQYTFWITKKKYNLKSHTGYGLDWVCKNLISCTFYCWWYFRKKKWIWVGYWYAKNIRLKKKQGQWRRKKQMIMYIRVYIYDQMHKNRTVPAKLQQGWVNPRLLIKKLTGVNLTFISPLRSIHPLHPNTYIFLFINIYIPCV